MQIKKHIPNFVTSLNAVCGFLAIIYAFQSDFMQAFYFVFLAAFFDFLDGGVARLLNVQSELGKQMDSLCDAVSFGVAPGVILFSMMRHTLGLSLPLDFETMTVTDILLQFSVVVVPVFSIVRLAKFNTDTRQSDSFIGLPVPANAMFISALGALLISCPVFWIRDLLTNSYVLLAIALVQSYLLVSPLPMFALKFKNLSWADNKLRFVFLAVSAVLVLTFGVLGLAFVIVLYVVLSLVIRLIEKWS